MSDNLPAKRKPGRKTVFSEEKANALIEAVRGGNFPGVAARLAGIDRDTLRRWRKWGESGKEPFAAFERKLAQAEIECEAFHVKNWNDQAPQDWRASKEFLARRHPERWSDHAAKLAVLGPDGIGFNIGTEFQISIHLGLDEAARGKWGGGGGAPRAIEVKAEPIAIEDAKGEPEPGEPRN